MTEDVLADPTVAPPKRWVAALNVATVGLWASFYGPIQVLLALQAAALTPGDKTATFGLVTGFGAAVSLVAGPVTGMLSDRTTSRFGRRIPWVVGGALAGAASLLLVSQAHSVVLLVIGWCCVQATVNGLGSAVTAAIPDQVPERQRGTVSGLVGVAQTTGVLAGTLIASTAAGITAGYITLAVFLLVAAVPYVWMRRDLVLDRSLRPTFRLGPFLASFVTPLRHHDFAWAWGTRFLINVGNAMVTLYLLYYLQDAVHYPDAKGGVFTLTLLYALFLVVTALISGRWSDRAGRRKVFVVVAGLVMAVAALMLAAVHTWPVAMVAAAVFGAGYGVYAAIDFALLTQVLPVATDRGKDLGVINIANTLPQVLAPTVAAPIIANLGGYTGLYVTAATATVAGAVLVTRIKSVR